MATCERDPTAGGDPGTQPDVPLRPSRSGDPGPGPGEAPDRSLLAVPARTPRTPSFASEWDEVITRLWVGSGWALGGRV